jgi:hypothetical protein
MTPISAMLVLGALCVLASLFGVASTTARAPTQICRRMVHASAKALALNDITTIDITPGMMLRQLHLCLNATPTLTAGNNTAAKTILGDTWGLVKRIDLILDGDQTIRSLTGRELQVLNWLLVGMPRIQALLGDSGAANPVLSSTLRLPLWSLGTIRPIDTILPTARRQAISLKITTGTFTDINGSASAWTTAPTLDCVGDWSYYPANADLTLVPPIYPSSINRKTFDCAGSGDNTFRLQVGSGARYRGILMGVHAVDRLSDSALALRTTIKSGPTTYYDSLYNVDKDDIHLSSRGGLPTGDGAGTGTAVTAILGGSFNPFKSSLSNLTAWQWIDFCKDGRLSESLNATALSELLLTVNTSAACALTVVPFLWGA